MAGVRGARDVFVVKGIYRGLCQAYATKRRRGNDVECVKPLAGDRVWEVHKMYSDIAPEITAAM
eukprot:10652394-Alexandrium_andersonii.AAC.1